jgi:hypothetical protein
LIRLDWRHTYTGDLGRFGKDPLLWSRLVSDDVLTIIPADPFWQPSHIDGARAAVLAVELMPVRSGLVSAEAGPRWHASVAFVDCGSNFEEVACRRCGATIEMGWWSERMDERAEGGFADLRVRLPCCGRASSLNDLDYRWPCGFASFEITIWNPQRPWFGDEEVAVIEDALGHAVRQVRAHY